MNIVVHLFQTPCWSAGVNSGQPIIQVGLLWLWIPHSVEAGLRATCGVWHCFCLLNGASWSSFCFVRLLATWLWAFGQFHYQILTFFCCLHVRLPHCKMHIYIYVDIYVDIMRFVVASFALWFCDSATLTDDDIEILRWHVKLWNNELKRQLATNDRWAARTEATELFSAEFHPNVAQTQNGVAKTHGSGDWFWRMALCTQVPQF